MAPITPTQARQQIASLIERYRALDEATRKSMSEASVVHQFITPLLEALGWPVHDPARFKYELNTQVGRPDMTLLPDQGGLIFVEAKRFGVIQELAQARTTLQGVVTPGQMALPGMAADRTREEQQAINYAFQNGGVWAILTNFERLRLFNARRDWLVLSFEHPTAYRDQFDLLWQLSYEAVLSGELERLNTQRHREDVDTAYLAFINEWRERLAQDILAQPSANPWAFRADGRIDVAILREVVQRILDRLVVIRFAEDHLVIPPSALQSIHDLRQANPYTFPLNQSYAQMFRVFDDRHNSGLFAPSLADQAVLSDAVLAGLTAKLYEARYRAFTADIMGNTYEQYLGKTLAQRGATVETVDNLETRKKQGSYYTIQVIVRYLVDHSLGRTLYGTENGRPDGQPLPGERRKTAAEIRTLRLLDMACGSGGFLIYAYDVLAEFYRLEIARLERERQERLHELMQQGVTTPFDLELQLAPWKAELDRINAFPTFILENHLYGVDLDPQAAELATVNLLMRAMADMRASEDLQQRQARLPLILNQNVKVGNSLIGALPDDPRLAGHADALAELRRLRVALAAEARNDPHNPALARIAELTGQVTAALNDGLVRWFADPATQRPLHWPVEFPEVFLGEDGLPAAEGGFTITVGNPPWEIVKPELREYYAQFDAAIESKYTREQVERRIAELDTDPVIAAGWTATKERIEAQAAYYRKASAFTRQGRGDTATHKLFVERAYTLLQERGRLAYVIPSGIYTDLGTKELRE
ncbi:MAG TPA: DNA methyltransferase, partial [Anaerolineae bacterium]|nr:DNA methyltransferase [Anaerolineae bacterium]